MPLLWRPFRVRGESIRRTKNFYRESVSFAMKQLRENGYIVMDRDNLISLTDAGMEIARRIYTRHKVLTQYLMQLGVNEQTARQDACKIEHDISPETFEAIRAQLKA